MANNITLTPIGYIDSPYKEKFAIPRQPGLVASAKGKIILVAPYNHHDLIRGIEHYSHLWIIFNFHATAEQGWKPLVRPPRLGGNKKLGVLATRSTFRPNPIGMSVVKLESVKQTSDTLEIHISSLDLLDKTPVLDIKPYIRYSDAILDTNDSFAQSAPEIAIKVDFNSETKNQIKELKANHLQHIDLRQVIIEVLQQDPRPAYKRKSTDKKVYGTKLYDLNIRWHYPESNTIEVINITRCCNED